MNDEYNNQGEQRHIPRLHAPYIVVTMSERFKCKRTTLILLLGCCTVVRWTKFGQFPRQLELVSDASGYPRIGEAPERIEAQRHQQIHPTFNSSRMIFYNVFVGTDSEQFMNAIRITQEQIEYLNASKWKYAPLLYTLIGNDRKIIRYITEQKQNSRILQYKEQGDESATLDKMYDYCHENSEATVLYIHSKGTFHPSEDNDRYRRFNMRGATGPECFDAISPGKTGDCNVCGARFSPLPHFHFAGNMFTAHCSYVKKLTRPSQLPAMMDRYHKEKNAVYGPYMHELPEFMNGRGRFAYEHWIGTHPGILPCDVYVNDTYQHGYTNLPDNDNYPAALRPSPRLSRLQMVSTLGQLEFLHPIFNLEARFAEWEYLYPGEVPSDWVWTYFERRQNFGLLWVVFFFVVVIVVTGICRSFRRKNWAKNF